MIKKEKKNKSNEKGDIIKEQVLESYNKTSVKYVGNSNSLHKLGLESKKLEDAATRQIKETLNLKDYDVIYTSGNSESMTTILINTKGNISTSSEELINISKEMGISLNQDKAKYKHIDIKEMITDDLNKYDFITLEDEIPGIGLLIKRKNIEIEPLIHGGKSTTKYRSGTAPTPLIVSISKLIKLKYKN